MTQTQTTPDPDHPIDPRARELLRERAQRQLDAYEEAELRALGVADEPHYEAVELAAAPTPISDALTPPGGLDFAPMPARLARRIHHTAAPPEVVAAPAPAAVWTTPIAKVARPRRAAWIAVVISLTFAALAWAWALNRHRHASPPAAAPEIAPATAPAR